MELNHIQLTKIQIQELIKGKKIEIIVPTKGPDYARYGDISSVKLFIECIKD